MESFIRLSAGLIVVAVLLSIAALIIVAAVRLIGWAA